MYTRAKKVTQIAEANTSVKPVITIIVKLFRVLEEQGANVLSEGSGIVSLANIHFTFS